MTADVFKAANRSRLAGTILLVMATALVAGCGTGANHTTSPTTASRTTSTSSKSTGPTGPGGDSSSANGSTTTTAPTTLAPATTTTAAGPSYDTISGTYNAGTADGGWLYIRSDGASRLRLPDGVACPNCITAASPIADIDFSLTSISSTGPNAYKASGTVLGTSDPTLAKMLSAPATIGSPISLTIASGGHLTLSVLPSTDTLAFSSKQAPPSTASPCTVAAVSGPVAAANPGQPSHISGVTCSSDGEWAAASISLGQGQGVSDTIAVLAGDGAQWYSVTRATVCNNHDITPSFFNNACSTS